ncbi:MAG: ABC transporter ATP-binding protein [bacterium]|nr:ABC transporter ATP-binding protein [bacterium]
MGIIHMEDIYKEYRSGDGLVNALNGVSLDINKGEFVAITGTSGSGKSTLLNILGGLERETRGEVYYNKQSVAKYSKLSEYRRENIGFVFQSFNLLPILTVEENICLPLLIRGEEISQTRVDEVIKRLNLDNKRKTLSKQLSGGEQQRTAIGRAIISKPQILLADEPTGNLDSVNTKRIMELLREMNEEGQTIVMVTHDTSIAASCSRNIVLEDGKIIEDIYR